MGIKTRGKNPESAIVKAVLDYLRLRGIFAWRNNTTGIFDPTRKVFRTFHGLKGVSDVLGLLDGGRLLAVEVKRPGGKVSAEQAEFIDAVNRRGGLAFVATGIGDVMKALDAEGK